MKLSDFRKGATKFKQIKKQKEIVKVLAYCLMPNHFHLLVRQEAEGGITEFLSKVTNSYTRYFNTKYDRIGPLLQGTFKAKLIDGDAYLLQLSKYIHRNPFKLLQWKNKIYPYSSYGYYLSKEGHPFCDTRFILSYFSKNNPKLNYQDFVEEGGVDDPHLFDSLIDGEDE